MSQELSPRIYDSVQQEIDQIHSQVSGHSDAETVSYVLTPGKSVTEIDRADGDPYVARTTAAVGTNGLGDELGYAVRSEGKLVDPRLETTAELSTQSIDGPSVKTVVSGSVESTAGRYEFQEVDKSGQKRSVHASVNREGYGSVRFNSQEKQQRAAELIASLAAKSIRKGIK